MFSSAFPRKFHKTRCSLSEATIPLKFETAHAGLVGDALQLTIPGQPSYDLVPTRGLVFNLKGLNGFSVEFEKDPSGKVSEMLVVEPGGATVAKKKS